MRHLHAVLIVGVSSLAALPQAQALSFGRVRSAVILGQPLSVAVPIVLSQGEDPVVDECVRAEVMYGESALPANAIRARVTRGADELSSVVRVSSSTAVEEPVVTITVYAGCPPRLSRSFTLLADPSTTVARTTSTTTLPADTARSDRAAQGASPALVAAGESRQRPERVVARREPAPPRAAAAEPRNDAAPTQPGVVPSGPLPSANAAPRRTQPVKGRTAEPEKPRLQLESGSILAGGNVVPVVAAPDPAASAALAKAASAQAAVAAAEGRVKALEAEVDRLKTTTKEQADSIGKLQARVAQGPMDGNQWLPWIAGLAAAALALAGYLAWRMRRLAAETKRNAWWVRENQSSLLQSRVTDLDREEPPSVRAAAVVTRAPVDAPPGRSFSPSTVNVAPETIPAPVASTTTAVIGRQARASSMQSDMQADTHRAVTVDEQIDLEQQADFFIALGHDDAAIDLLLAHLRNTGGAAPIPYLKLLEMYRRRGDRDDYEVMRRRFNQRFNSVAPEWDDYGQAGRPLVDYPKQMARLQAVWSSPLDAMAELEAMAFGRGDEKELFDLPAYQDVLFLYQLARQLQDDNSSGKGSGVDVLLPIGGETAAGPLVTSLDNAPSAEAAGASVMGALDVQLNSERMPLTMRAMPQIDLNLPPRTKPKS